MDIVLRAYKKHLDHIFLKFAGITVEVGEKASLDCEEFIEFVSNSGLLNDQFVAREIPVIFNMSMLTQVDEIYSGRHL